MQINRDQLVEHLRFAAELGVPGVSRDHAWCARVESSTVEALGSTNNPPFVVDVSAPVSAGHIEHTEDPGGSEVLVTPVVIARNAGDALAALRADIGPQCARCKLHALGRRQVVFGEGNPSADLMFVGEAPGADEDEQGVPFIGRAGQLLTKIIEAIGLTRGDVYIANVIKCRPPQNRNPEPDEIATCEPFLFQQLDIIKPKVVVALGKFAAQTLLKSTDPISRLRGRVIDYRGAKLVPTFHPAYVLRNPASKREVWEDMKLVRSLLQPTPANS